MSEVVDLTIIKGMLVAINEKQDSMAKQLESIDKDLSLLSQTVIGNKEYGQKGLVEQVEVLNKYVENDKKKGDPNLILLLSTISLLLPSFKCTYLGDIFNKLFKSKLVLGTQLSPKFVRYLKLS